MRFLKQMTLIFIAIFTFSACEKEEVDNVGPTIEITNIVDNQEFKFGDDLRMNFKFTDQTGVYEYAYELYSKDFLPKEFTVEQKVFDLNGSFKEISLQQVIILPAKTPSETFAEGDYVIKVQASDDHQIVSTFYKPIRIVYPTAE